MAEHRSFFPPTSLPPHRTTHSCTACTCSILKAGPKCTKSIATVAWSVPSHYLNQWWNIASWILRKKFRWNFNRNSYIFIQENALENAICKMTDMLSWPQCANNFHVISMLLPCFYSYMNPQSTLIPYCVLFFLSIFNSILCTIFFINI